MIVFNCVKGFPQKLTGLGSCAGHHAILSLSATYPESGWGDPSRNHLRQRRRKTHHQITKPHQYLWCVTSFFLKNDFRNVIWFLASCWSRIAVTQPVYYGGRQRGSKSQSCNANATHTQCNSLWWNSIITDDSICTRLNLFGTLIHHTDLLRRQATRGSAMSLGSR